MAKRLKYKDANGFLRQEVNKHFGYSLKDAAEKMGVSASNLRSELTRVKPERKPTWLLDALGLKTVTYVVRAEK